VVRPAGTRHAGSQPGREQRDATISEQSLVATEQSLCLFAVVEATYPLDQYEKDKPVVAWVE
jgi:hypothetical protein